MTMRVLIAVTHLLGAGHLTRAAALARAFSAGGHEVTLVSGGLPSALVSRDGIDFVQLPPVKTVGTDFRTLLDETGQAVDAAYLEARKACLLEAFARARPDLLVTELFPFGRRVLADEFLALVEAARAARPRPLVACSIRDILVAPGRADRIAEAHGRLTRFYDAVFVHGDPNLAPLDASWPVAEHVRPLLRYTGYVDEGAAPARGLARKGIVVSGGSSAAGLPLYRAALAAAALVADRPWRVLVGRGVADDDFSAFQASAPPHVVVERARPDFRDLLAGAEVSVSQAGYNTAVDLLRTGPAAVLVPFEAGHETEQRLRAERLKAMGVAELVPEDALTPERLAQAIRTALGGGQAGVPDVALDGAQRTVRIAEGLRRGPALHPSFDWAPVEEALSRARDAGTALTFWWRDDDVTAPTPALDRLLDLARRYGTGLALAAIPGRIEPALRERLAGEDAVDVLVHGRMHRNHAPEDAKKAEFGPHRPAEVLAREAAEGLRLCRRALPRSLPVFVPPWNRIAPSLVPVLPGLGYCGLSTAKDRRSPDAAPGLVQINTHVDPIAWHGSRSLVDPHEIVAGIARAVTRRIRGDADPREAIGLLTHHLVHDEAVWSFCERLLERLRRNSIRFVRAQALFSFPSGSSREDDAL